MQQIQVVGLTTTEIQCGYICIQYRLLTKVGELFYDYTFTPDFKGKYTLKTSPAVENTVEMKPLSATYIEWDKQKLLIISDEQYDILFDSTLQTFTNPTDFFLNEVEMRPKRLVLIINGNPGNILPFIATNHTCVYADTWNHLPNVIPEDIIVINAKHFPIEAITVRLPPHTKAVVVNTEYA